MRIIRLTGRDYERLTAVDITPPKYMVKVAGFNGEGKTSLLHAIRAAL